jgi:very-short-patch-repair endonuclease
MSGKKGANLKSKQHYVELGNKLHSNFYDYSKYIYHGAYVKGIITCPVHGDFVQTMNSHTNKAHPRGCSKCALMRQGDRCRKTQEKYISECQEKHGVTYILDDILYTEAHAKITPICRKHGKWETSAHSFLNGKGCPICKESQGEKLVAMILGNMEIAYERQKRYSDCRGKKYPLPFDFYLPSYNTLIEYDGEQHTRPVRFYDAEKANSMLLEVQCRDNIKTEFCKSKGIPLIRLDYTMSENEILEKIKQIVA